MRQLALAQVFLAKIDGSDQYLNAACVLCDWAVNDAPRAPLGLLYLSDWGSIRHAGRICLPSSCQPWYQH